ncbi:hypothetical protein C8N24_4866 [Solirubrobacter pauli]|uniref:Uncharacterized protein n=1 Tax=Solirubrobacter pauli TaxID=166793 RepID=A0A660KYR1_9ACTN|nr:hypothetical protein [Solirubrobacter pauli]RKQ86851.1 hypothetical protein C8N24_4866 [Solirubrobacter pauli]
MSVVGPGRFGPAPSSGVNGFVGPVTPVRVVPGIGAAAPAAADGTTARTRGTGHQAARPEPVETGPFAFLKPTAKQVRSAAPYAIAALLVLLAVPALVSRRLRPRA